MRGMKREERKRKGSEERKGSKERDYSSDQSHQQRTIFSNLNGGLSTIF